LKLILKRIKRISAIRTIRIKGELILIWSQFKGG